MLCLTIQETGCGKAVTKGTFLDREIKAKVTNAITRHRDPRYNARRDCDENRKCLIRDEKKRETSMDRKTYG